MILLIDAYNLLKTIEKSSHVSGKQINRFITDLGRYAKKSDNRVIAVFDGGPDIYPRRAKEPGIVVMHSGQREHADDLIKRYLDEHKGKDILLVSTDRELDGYAQKLGFEYIDSYDFHQLMRERLAGEVELSTTADDVPHKMSEGQDAELDELMEQASEDVHIKHEDRVLPGPPRHKENKLTKAQRRALKKLRKI